MRFSSRKLHDVKSNSTQTETPTVQKSGEHFNLRTPQNPADTLQRFGDKRDVTSTASAAVEIKQDTLQRFGDKRDVGELLGICNRSVDNLLAKGCPHLKLGKRRVRFDLDDVREWAKREFGTRRVGKEKRVVNPICFCTSGIRPGSALVSVLWFLFRYFAAWFARLLTDIDNETECDL